MARRIDTGWRDGQLSARHEQWGYAFPVAGMTFPMIEYDNGEPVALISYMRRGERFPEGVEVNDAYAAFRNLHRENSPGGTGEQLPFFTVQYDPRNWSYLMFGHNDPAREFLGTSSWVAHTESAFVSQLYRLRGRHTPDLAPYGISLSNEWWIDSEPSPDRVWVERWPHQLMSSRRRAFEPVGQVRMSWRNPCLDIDLAVINKVNEVALLVDYKAPGARINVDSTNMKALSHLHPRRAPRVPAMLVSYEPATAPLRTGWTFRAYALNRTASTHLAFALGQWSGGAGDYDDALANAVVGDWVDLSEAQWRSVLDAARDL